MQAILLDNLLAGAPVEQIFRTGNYRARCEILDLCTYQDILVLHLFHPTSLSCVDGHVDQETVRRCAMPVSLLADMHYVTGGYLERLLIS
jgi:hypothetical protein